MATKVLDYSGLTYYNTKLTEKITAEYVAKDGTKVLSDVNFSTADKARLDAIKDYVLPMASADDLGGIKVGAGLSIDDQGILSAVVTEKVTWDTLDGKPPKFTPDTHTHTTTDITDFDAKVDAKIAGTSHLSREIVTELPETTAAKENVVYMKKKDGGEGQNVYEEYLYIAESTSFELIGSSDVDLSGYVKTGDLAGYVKTETLDGYVQDSELTGYVQTETLTTTLEGYAKTTDLEGYLSDADIESITNDEIDELFTDAEPSS